MIQPPPHPRKTVFQLRLYCSYLTELIWKKIFLLKKSFFFLLFFGTSQWRTCHSLPSPSTKQILYQKHLPLLHLKTVQVATSKENNEISCFPKILCIRRWINNATEAKRLCWKWQWELSSFKSLHLFWLTAQLSKDSSQNPGFLLVTCHFLSLQ